MCLHALAQESKSLYGQKCTCVATMHSQVHKGHSPSPTTGSSISDTPAPFLKYSEAMPSSPSAERSSEQSSEGAPSTPRTESTENFAGAYDSDKEFDLEFSTACDVEGLFGHQGWERADGQSPANLMATSSSGVSHCSKAVPECDPKEPGHLANPSHVDGERRGEPRPLADPSHVDRVKQREPALEGEPALEPMGHGAATLLDPETPSAARLHPETAPTPSVRHQSGHPQYSTAWELMSSSSEGNMSYTHENPSMAPLPTSQQYRSIPYHIPLSFRLQGPQATHTAQAAAAATAAAAAAAIAHRRLHGA